MRHTIQVVRTQVLKGTICITATDMLKTMRGVSDIQVLSKDHHTATLSFIVTGLAFGGLYEALKRAGLRLAFNQEQGGANSR